MKDIIVISHATHRAHLIDEYEEQLRHEHIDFHIEPVVLEDGIGSMTMRWRVAYWQRMAEQFSKYDRIVFTDAWDVLFYGTKEALCSKIPPLVMSAERNCWPDESLGCDIPGSGPWRYANPGMMAGYPHTISSWSKWAVSQISSEWLDQMDQKCCNYLLVNHYGTVPPLDSNTAIFYVVSQDKEDGSLRHDLTNIRYGTSPQFFHFAGPCHPSRFRSLLRKEISVL